MTIMDSMSDSELDARDGHKLFKNNDGSYNESVVSFSMFFLLFKNIFYNFLKSILVE